jgi:hypothetical protein
MVIFVASKRSHLAFVKTLTLACLLGALGCGRNDPEPIPEQPGSPYFPLTRGNVWVFQNSRLDRWWKVIEVVDYVKIGDSLYACVTEQEIRDGEAAQRLYSYYKLTEGRKVEGICLASSLVDRIRSGYSRDEIDRAYTLRYDFEADSGATWRLRMGGPRFERTVTMKGRVSMMTVRGIQYSDIVRFDVESGLDGVVEEAFARDIGPILMAGDFDNYYLVGFGLVRPKTHH